jgi:hypothetical protein
MRRNTFFLTLLTGLLFVSACKKEYSYELGGTSSSGSLQSNVTGECLPKTVQGIYEAGTVVNGSTNYIDIQVSVASAGNYRIYSDTVNGIFFQAKGTFASTGVNSVRLAGNGTPTNAGVQSFVITYDSTECSVAVTTVPKGAAGPAEFTLSGGPGTCLDFNLSGNYIVGQALNTTNTVAIKVNVTKIGTYNVNTGTESNGMIFSGSGVLTALGAQTITLTGTGTPAVAAPTVMNVAGGTGCGFTVSATQGAGYTIDCASAIVNGIYESGTALDATNTITLTANVTGAGPYSITATQNGMSFTGSGNFATAGPGQAITLFGTGVPVTYGDFNVQIPGYCTFEVTVDPSPVGAGGTWKFTSAGTLYDGITFDADELIDNNITYLTIEGIASVGTSAIILTMIVDGGGQITTGDYSGTATTGKMAGFTHTYGTATWIAGLGTGSSVNIKLTTYNTVTKKVKGTFSGEAVELATGIKHQITGGTFTANLP